MLHVTRHILKVTCFGRRLNVTSHMAYVTIRMFSVKCLMSNVTEFPCHILLVICCISHGTCLLYNKLYFKHIFRPSLAIFFLTDIFVYIPAASLGAVIIVAAGGMFSLDSIHVRILQFLIGFND